MGGVRPRPRPPRPWRSVGENSRAWFSVTVPVSCSWVRVMEGCRSGPDEDLTHPARSSRYSQGSRNTEIPPVQRDVHQLQPRRQVRFPLCKHPLRSPQEQIPDLGWGSGARADGVVAPGLDGMGFQCDGGEVGGGDPETLGVVLINEVGADSEARAGGGGPDAVEDGVVGP